MKNIKISIITTCLNSEKTIAYTLNSVFLQKYKNIEHIIIDGGSKDSTVDILKKHKLKNKRIFIKKNLSIYKALNFGIKKSSGEYILILNSDDVLNESQTISKVVKIINKSEKKIFLGDVVYFNKAEFTKIKRFYSASKFKLWQFRYGHMPPHPGAFISRDIAIQFKYNPNYQIASDYDFFLRVLKLNKKPFKFLNMIITRMRTGGISGKNLKAHFISSYEINSSLKNNNIYSNLFFVNLRYLIKLLQLFYFKKVEKKIQILKYYENFIIYDFQILKSIKKINFKRNFVLSALNLAYLGNYCVDKVRNYRNLIHWPDGLFARKFNNSLKKIPGRLLLDQLRLPGNIKKIIVLGNLPNQSLQFLKKKFNRKVINYELPYGEVNKIKKKIRYRIKKNDLVMITLPTPKQEQIAELLISKVKNYKVICIGGSINIKSGVERVVPKIFQQFEFIWRLRYDTKRRTERIIKTFLNYLIGKYFLNKFKNISIQIIK